MNVSQYMAWEGLHYLIQILKSDEDAKAADFWIVCYFSLSEMYDYKFKFEAETSVVIFCLDQNWH